MTALWHDFQFFLINNWTKSLHIKGKNNINNIELKHYSPNTSVCRATTVFVMRIRVVTVFSKGQVALGLGHSPAQLVLSKTNLWVSTAAGSQPASCAADGCRIQINTPWSGGESGISYESQTSTLISLTPLTLRCETLIHSLDNKNFFKVAPCISLRKHKKKPFFAWPLRATLMPSQFRRREGENLYAEIAILLF